MNEPNSRPTHMGPAIAVCAAVLIIAVALGVVVIGRGDAPADGPNEAPAHDSDEAPARNAWAGWRRCAECHEEQAADWERSGHSHTFAFTRDSEVAQSVCGRTLRESGAYGRFEYLCDDEGLTVALAERFGGNLFPLDFAMGSGQHAVTFFTLMPDGDETVGIEHRLTWYAADDALDLTPGHENLRPGAHAADYFGRVMRSGELHRCLGCHTTDYRIDDHRLAAVVPNVQCEACHGPGIGHVGAAEAGDAAAIARTIERPDSAAAEVALCGRCHRTPDEIPSDRLQRYPDSLVRFQPVGLLQSRCYTESPHGLACTTCHNPHAPAGSIARVEHERTCLACHESPTQTVCPVSPRTGCVSCHMPSIELVRGISFHDHWIRVRSDETPDVSERPGSHSTLPADR